MKYFLALLGVAALCGCGHSSHTTERTETITTTETVVAGGKCVKSCGSGKCVKVEGTPVEVQSAQSADVFRSPNEPAPTNKIGVSKPYSKESWTVRCVSGGCSRWSKEDIAAQKEGDRKAAAARGEAPVSDAAAIVELPPEPGTAKESTVPVSAAPAVVVPVPASNNPGTTTTTTVQKSANGTTTTTTTTRVIRWPRKLD